MLTSLVINIIISIIVYGTIIRLCTSMGEKVFRDRGGEAMVQGSANGINVNPERSSRNTPQCAISWPVFTHTHRIVTSQYYMYLACAGYRESTCNIAITSSFVLQPNRQTLGGYMPLVARRSTSLNLRVQRCNANALRSTCKTARILHIVSHQIACSCLLKYISDTLPRFQLEIKLLGTLHKFSKIKQYILEILKLAFKTDIRYWKSKCLLFYTLRSALDVSSRNAPLQPLPRCVIEPER